MKQLTKQEYQKRSLAISTLVIYLESTKAPLASVLYEILSPIGEEKHPYKWTDNEFLGSIEKALNKLHSNGEDAEW